MPPTAAQAYQSLQDFDKSRTTPDAAISAGENKYGVGGLRGQLDSLRTLTGNLQTSIENVDPSVRGRTAGSLVTEAQRQAITNNEQAPLIGNFNKTSAALTDTGHQYDEASGLASNYANSLLNSDKEKYQNLFNNYSTLSQQEQAAAAAAESKRQFDAQMAESKASRAASSGGGAGLVLGGNTGGNDTHQSGDTATPAQHLGADIQKLIPADYASKFNDGYTERQITRLQQAYPEISPAQVAAAVYNYRKQLTGT